MTTYDVASTAFGVYQCVTGGDCDDIPADLEGMAENFVQGMCDQVADPGAATTPTTPDTPSTTPTDPTPTVPTTTPTTGYTCFTGVDILGTDLSVTVTDYASCEAACAADASCTFFLTTTSGQCVTKSDLLVGANGGNNGVTGRADYIDQACVANSLVSASSYACAAGYDFLGTEISVTAGATVESCQQACSGDQECTFFILTTDAQCVLKKDFMVGLEAGPNQANGPATYVSQACVDLNYV